MSKATQYFVICLWIACVLVLGTSANTQGRSGYPRSNRGFKGHGLSTARGFGKRDPSLNFASLPQNNVEGFVPFNLEMGASYPSTWLIEEIQNNPEVARLVVEKLVDANGDGELSPDELSRKIYY